MIELISSIVIFGGFILAVLLFAYLDRPEGRTGHHDSYPGSYYYDSHRKKWD